jgi:hypothetical protein
MIKSSVGGRTGAVAKAVGAWTMKSLGVLITSDRYPDYATNIITAAHAKGLVVRVYLTGTARNFIDLPQLSKVWKKAECVVSFENVIPVNSGETGDDTRSLTAAESRDLSLFLEACDRHIVL